MNIKRMTLAIMAMSCLASMPAAEKITSPDGKLTVIVDNENGSPTYLVSFGDVVFVEKSPLGLKLNFEDLTKGLTLKECKVNPVKETYDLKTIKQSHVTYEANVAVCQFEKGSTKMDIIFSVSNRDVAYRYKLYPRRARGGETLAAIVIEER
mgnify:CR=1 FL=1